MSYDQNAFGKSLPTIIYGEGPKDWVFCDTFNEGLSVSGTTGLAKWYMLETNAAAVEIEDIAQSRGMLKITQNAADNDVVSLIANTGFRLDEMAPGQPVTFGVRFRVTDVDDCDVNIGLVAAQDESIATAVTDWVGFNLTEGSAAINLQAVKDSSAKQTNALATAADATFIRAHFQYFPTSTMSTGRMNYVIHSNGTMTRGNVDMTTFPDDVILAPVIQFQNGSAEADVMSVDWIYCHAIMAAYTEGTG